MEVLQLVETEVVAASVVSVEQLDVLKQDTLQVELVTVEQVGERGIEIISDIVTEREELTSEIIDVVTDRQVLIEVLEFSPGPAGPPGASEDEMMYAKRVDMVSDNLLYRGEAAVGSTTSAAAWRVRRITIGVDGDVTEEWAGGTANFDKTWDGRLGYTYS